ncbi:MAG TPA: dTDP-4-dehydrorhamnose reductase [Coriobacteriia bacterium]
MKRPLLIAGAGGMLGHAMQVVGAERGFETYAPEEGSFDITSHEMVPKVVAAFAKAHPTGAVVNCAAYTNVDAAEENAQAAFLVNQFGAALLAENAAANKLPFVHISTDFVFDGKKAGSYSEVDEPNPLSIYGASKMAGEWAVAAADPKALIIRTAWSFGPGGLNFPTKILERARKSDKIQVVSDEVGSPTYTIDLAAALLRLIDVGATGLLHVAGSGWCARDEMAREILRLAGLGRVEVESVNSATFPGKAERPANAILDCSKAAVLGVIMPSWRDALARFVPTLS